MGNVESENINMHQKTMKHSPILETRKEATIKNVLFLNNFQYEQAILDYFIYLLLFCKCALVSWTAYTKHQSPKAESTVFKPPNHPVPLSSWNNLTLLDQDASVKGSYPRR